MVHFNQSQKSITIQDLAWFEQKFNVHLPSNYKTLLLKYNGGMPRESEYIEQLLSIKYGDVKVENIIQIHQKDNANIPMNYLPFALSWGRNILALNLNNDAISI